MALLACFERDFPTSDDKLMKRNFPLTVIIHWKDSLGVSCNVLEKDGANHIYSNS